MTNALVCGFGSIGQRHVRLLREMGQKVHVFSRRKHSEEEYYQNLEAALSEVHPEYVVIANETSEHESTLKEVLSFGVPKILVEKPLWTENDQQIKDLEKLARKNQIVCYTAYNHRFEPHFIKMRDLIETGSLGKIYSCRMFYGNGTSRLVRDSLWRDKESGVLNDLGLMVYFNSSSEGSPKDILLGGVAKCTGFSKVYVELTRRFGLNSETRVGLVYSGGTWGAHMWAVTDVSSYSKMEVDPTMGFMGKQKEERGIKLSYDLAFIYGKKDLVPTVEAVTAQTLASAQQTLFAAHGPGSSEAKTHMPKLEQQVATYR